MGGLTLSGCSDHGTVTPTIHGEDKNTATDDSFGDAEEATEGAKELELEEQNQNLVDLEDYTVAPKDNGCPYYVKVNRQRNVVTVYTLDED